MATVADWDKKAEWMRSIGAKKASWDTKGQLLELELDAEPAETVDDEQLEAVRDARELSDKLRRDRLQFGAVPGLRSKF